MKYLLSLMLLNLSIGAAIQKFNGIESYMSNLFRLSDAKSNSFLVSV